MPSSAEVTPLAGGGYVATWHMLSPEELFDLPDQEMVLYVQVFDADMDPVSSRVPVDPDVSHYTWAYETLAAEDGGFTVIWTASGDLDPYRSVGQVYGRSFDASGAATGDATALLGEVNIADGAYAFLLDTCVLDDGSIAILWADWDGSDADPFGPVQVTVFDGSLQQLLFEGEVPGAPDVPQPGEGVQTSLALSAGDDGGFTVAWIEDSQQYSVGYDDEYVLQGDTPQTEPFTTELTSGRILEVQAEITGGDDVDLSYRVLGQDGTTVVWDWSDVALDTEGSESLSQVFTLPEGGFALLWQQEEGDETVYHLRSFAADGTPTQVDYALGVFGNANHAGGFSLLNGQAVLNSSLYPDQADHVDEFLLRDSGQQYLNIFRVLEGTAGNDNLEGSAENDILTGNPGNDFMSGLAGNDYCNGGNGEDTLVGGAGDDVLDGGLSVTDRRDRLYGGDGNDRLSGGYGNDELRGDAGNDTLRGGFGSDTVIGGEGDDILTGSALSDLMFGGDGDDYLNGGFGFDRLNGGDGADRFFHLGDRGHGSDWIQDYSAAEGDVLEFGGTGSVDQFQVNFATTGHAGDAAIMEAFVIYRPTGQILWALVDGAGQDSINLMIDGTQYDLLA
ncbi:calcium-binding protein [Thalassovita mangrovi]|uniref:calcium-binding protein n=1 Tax=Thalassovita mangrovi TaxID=2692236 RepID=UPI00352215AE